ncbi:hypothetical protein TWF718_005447 [Orbilia javanica]|uniref:Uncharacterized protein n=1 Tax=Orbilia javanica TaxID=47235 RepID=A0AAN8MV08_9PEZI
MESVSKLVGCCGCGRSSGESSSSSSRGQHQSRTDAVINTQPGLVEPPMVVRVAKTVRQFTTRRRYPKPTWEELEAFYQEGKELARLQEEAEAAAALEAAEKLKLEQKTSEEQQQQPQRDHGRDLAGKGLIHDLTKDAAVAPPNPHSTFDGPSDIPFLGDDENEPSFPPLAHISPRHFSNPGQKRHIIDLDMRRVSNHNDRPLPALRQTGENTAISEADTDEIVAVLAAPDVACTTPPLNGTQKSKKMRLFFQDDRSRSSVYPSDEESMVYDQGTWSPRSPRIPSPVRSRLAVNKVRQNRHVSPGNLRIPSIMQVLGGVLSPSLAEPPQLPSQKPVELSELPHPDEFELTTDDAPVPDSGRECDTQPLPHPEEFGFEEILLTPPASPLLSSQPDRSISPIFSGAPFLELEMERIRRRIASETLYKAPWDKSTSDVSEAGPAENSPDTIRKGKSTSAHARNGSRRKAAAPSLGFLTIGSLSSLGALSSLSSLSLASNISLQAFGSINSPFFSPSFGSSSVFNPDQDLAGLLPCAGAEAPIHDTVADATAGVGTFAESLRKGGETIARGISSGFATILKRFGTGTVELQSTEPQPTEAIRVPCEPAGPAPSLTEGTPALSPTPSNQTLMRRILGLKVSGTLRGAAVASEAMSRALFTSDYTDCGLDEAAENPFEGFVWDAPDGKIPWYCDEDGVHFDDKVPVNRRFPAEYLCNPVIVPWEECVKEVELPMPPTSTAAGPKGVHVRQLTPPAAAPSTVAIEVSSEVASLATTPTQGSLVRSAGPETGMPEELNVPSASSSVDSFPRYIPISHRDARHSTCGLDLGKEQYFPPDCRL